MTDGITEAYRAEKRAQAWDAPRCYVCLLKFEPDDMRRHIENHTIQDCVNALVRWSVDTWKAERSQSSK